MAAKPETQFIKSIHDKLKPRRVYHEKTNNPFRSGIADVWYSGRLGDLWVEYKYIEKLPRSDEIKPDLSARQVKWLGDRYEEGRNVAVILGTRAGGVLYQHYDWLVPYSDKLLLPRLQPRPALAEWIFSQVGASPCLLSEPSRERRL